MRFLWMALALAVLLALPFWIWGEHFESAFDLEGTRAWLEGWGLWAWAAAIVLLTADIVLPLPSTMVLVVLGMLYGPVLGGLIGAAGSFLSGSIAYGACRAFGSGAARWLIGERDRRRGEAMFDAVGGWAVALSRWLPLLPEVIACVAGLVRMPAGRFHLALACGSVPMAFTYAAMGHFGADRPRLALVLSIVAPLLLWPIAARCLTRKARSSTDDRA